ncbi:MAG TPA: SusC/RagA family TonB-linked outer membrane protein [Bacteroidales bacterium]|nr:SusC/RagA family TonB-linked outer membrane protein [Bacteroidales bacterium]HPT20358.1 SusC/RagA family TonB-linked outer membrane protein [Bacteroidales bacterium]
MKKNEPFGELFYRSLKKTLPIMRNAIILLFVGILQANAIDSYSQKTRLSLNFADTKLVTVLDNIESESDFFFLYNEKLLDTERKVDVTANNELINIILDDLFRDTDVKYTIIDHKIILAPESLTKTSETSKITEQQQIVVKGKVTSNTGESLPGVYVTIKGTTLGVNTDIEGNYSIQVPDDKSTLLFSFIGFAPQEVVVGNQNVINITLSESMLQITEVVVTALGIKREKKALPYSVSEVKGEEFTQAKENNIGTALVGKIAGVNATGLNTGPGGSSRIIIRGNGSLTGANQPLYVVNGMPIDNTTPGGSATTNGGAGNVDRGDGMAGINSDDIESISVLKGGTAAALYGSRAANGVILITTKKGVAQKGIGVEYNSTFTMETPSIFPDWQYEYGQGDLGRKPTTKSEAIGWGRRSWGAKIDGSDYIAADGLIHPYSAQKNNIKNFYQTAKNFTNTIAFNGGSEGLTYRFSLSDLNSSSVLPNSTYNRKTSNLNLNGKFGKFTVQALAQYTLEDAKNRPTAGDATGNPNWTALMIANTADIRWLSPGYDALNNEIPWNDADVATNGYFVVNKFQQKDTRNRFIGQASINYDIMENLSVKGVVSRDFYNYNYKFIVPTGTRYSVNGNYNALKTDVAETNSMVNINYKKDFGKSFNIVAMAGANSRTYEYLENSISGSQFIIPYFYSQTNLNTITPAVNNQKIETNSIFGSVDAGYKGMVYLTFTGRNDWFSTLSPKNNSIFYPSIGGSFLLSQAVELPETISFAKLRASWAQVGGATPDPYAINLTYSMTPSSGIPLQDVSKNSINNNTITNANLKPLTSTTAEFGMDLQFFDSKLRLDLTYYDRKTTNDIVTTAISLASGYNNVILNVGELKNKGIETLIGATLVKAGDFSWNTSYNLAYNKNNVVKLAEGLDQIQMATTVNNYAYINNIVGRPYGTIVGTRIQKDENGNTVYNQATGNPVATGLQVLGNGVAPLTMGLTNNFSYKNFSLDVLIDGKFGNKVFSMMEVYGTRMGLTKLTLPGRENGLELNGVLADGSPYTRTVSKENLRIYYDNFKSYSEVFLHDGSFVKLRQIILTYKIPVNNLSILKIQSASISLVGRNLAILYRKTKNFDPEQSYTNSSNQGFESFGLPRTRSYGLNLMVKF